MTELQFLTIFGNSRRARTYLKSLDDTLIGPKLVALCGLGIIKCCIEDQSFEEFMDRVEEDSGWAKDNVVPFPGVHK